MCIKRIPLIDQIRQQCEDTYFEIIQMIDDFEVIQMRVEELYKNSFIYDRSLSDNPSDCYQTTLTENEEKLIDDILNPKDILGQVLNRDLIEDAYNRLGHEQLKEIKHLLSTLIEEYRAKLRYNLSIEF